jgi:hypothetical protein
LALIGASAGAWIGSLRGSRRRQWAPQKGTAPGNIAAAPIMCFKFSASIHLLYSCLPRACSKTTEIYFFWKILRARFYFLFYCGFGECERMPMAARRGPGCPQKICVYPHPAYPAMEMQGTFHCLLGASSSGHTTHKALKRMLPLGVPNRSEKVDTRGSSSSDQSVSATISKFLRPKQNT